MFLDSRREDKRFCKREKNRKTLTETHTPQGFEPNVLSVVFAV
jgi:hypothetical protein